MLSFLLFAGALHVDWSEMRRGRWPILVLSTIGVLLSTLIVGGGFCALTTLLGLGVPPIWCFVFGALISPTDPVAVMGVLKRAAVPPTLQATVAGESLFNDGVGVVVFIDPAGGGGRRASPFPPAMPRRPFWSRRAAASCSASRSAGSAFARCAASTNIMSR